VELISGRRPDGTSTARFFWNLFLFGQNLPVFYVWVGCDKMLKLVSMRRETGTGPGGNRLPGHDTRFLGLKSLMKPQSLSCLP